MRNKNCGDFAQILDYLQHSLPADKERDFRRHLEGCPECRALLAEATELIAFLREDASLQVYPQAHQRSIEMFRSWKETRLGDRPISQTNPLKRWLGRLVLDSRQNPGPPLPLAAGLRSAALTGPYQLLYTIDDGRAEVDLQIGQSYGRGNFSLIGQVVGIGGRPGRAELISREGGPARESLADETFTFRFNDIPPGEYRLNISNDQELIEIALLSL